MNKPNFSAEYFERSDDALLQLASDRSSLTDEAAAALNDELRRRNLTESDRIEPQQFDFNTRIQIRISDSGSFNVP